MSEQPDDVARLISRLERLLDERTTNQASATQLIVAGLHQDVAGLTEAVHQLGDQLTSLRVEIRDAFRDAGARFADHERRIQALEARQAICADCPRVSATTTTRPEGP